MRIANRPIGSGCPVYVIAELSANHHQSYDKAAELVRVAHDCGVDAVKLQTYTADTLTIRSGRPEFRVGGGTLWDGRTLYDLYEEAFTPWEWQPKLKALANQLGLHLFSTPFDPTAVDFLEEMGVPAHKIASFEIVDLPLIARIAQTGKPIILSTGMATLGEIADAVDTIRKAGGGPLALLKCTSAYPARADDMNLRTIPHLAQAFGCPVGLSDHTLGIAVPVAAVAVGACIIEKHLTLSRSEPGPDSAFSLEPHEFRQMVEAVRIAEKALGRVHHGVDPSEEKSRVFRRSLFVVRDMKAGEPFTTDNVRSIRPGHGLAPKFFAEILGRCASRNVESGTPLSWDLVGN